MVFPRVPVFFLLLLSSLAASAQVTRTWPGSAPCGATLQACIDGSAAGDTVLIAFAGEIDEDIGINKSFALRAAPNRTARFAAGRSVTGVASNGSVNWDIEGLRLRDGRIDFRHTAAASLTVRFVNNRLDSSGGAGVLLRVEKSNANGSASVDVQNNRVDAGSSNQPALSLSLNARTSGRVAFNQVQRSGGSAGTGAGLMLNLSPGDLHAMNVYGNRVEGNFGPGALRMVIGAAPNFGSAGSSTPVLRAFSNALICTRVSGSFPVGLYAASFAGVGDNELRLFNNTAVGCDTPIWIDYPIIGPSFTGSIFNNLIAHNTQSLVVSGNVVDNFTIERNLSFGNTFNTMPASATLTVTGDPRLRSRRFPRLTEGSAAINAGNAVSAQLLYGAAGAPQVDADGRRRTIGTGTTAVDIGAYEFGDQVGLARNGSAGSSSVALGVASEAVNVHISKSFNPVAGAPGASNPNPIGVFHLGEWFGYAIGSPLPANAYLHRFAPGANGSFGATYRHETASANTSFESTTLSNSYLNGKSREDAIVLATPVWLGGAQNSQNIAVGYNCPAGTTGANCWFIGNQALGASMPTGFAFHVYAQDPSPTAFVHRVTTVGRFSPLSSHPLLGDDPGRCARALATPRVVPGLTNNTTFDLEWRQVDGRSVWGIQGDASMPAGAEFFVFVDAAAYDDCAFPGLFKDGFEG
ncbi:MAG: hypothetical protein MEQ07_08035 [Aquimonas sp.]|nr:hypothetical protein [Aquimonas sp.]